MSKTHPEASSKNKPNKTGFKVTYSYAKGQDKGVDSLLAGVTAIEDLVISNTNVITVVEGTRESLSIQYTEEYDNLIAGYTDGAVRFYKTNNVDLVDTLIDQDITENPGPVTNIKHRPTSKNYPPTNTVICSYTNGCVKCWNYNFSQCLYTIREKRQTFGVAYHPRLPKFVTCGDDCKIFLYDEENRIQERIFSGSNSPGVMDGHTSRVFAACFNPRSNHELITGGWDDVVHFWDARQPFAVRHISGVHICGDGLDISPKGTEVLTCAWQTDQALQLWDYGSGQLIQTIEPDSFQSKLYCGRFINKDYIICGGTDPNILRVISLKDYTVLSAINKLPGAVYSIDIGPYKKVKIPEVPVKKNQKMKKLIIEDQLFLPKIAFSSGKRIYQIDFS